MPRRDGEVFFFGTAMVILENQAPGASGFSAEGALIGDARVQG
jgi:hypothetical protein